MNMESENDLKRNAQQQSQQQIDNNYVLAPSKLETTLVKNLTIKSGTDYRQRDTDRLRELEYQNLQLQEEIIKLRQKSARQLESFASTVHELRTPLNCIVCLTDLLLLDDADSISTSSMDNNNNNNKHLHDSNSFITNKASLSLEQRDSIQLIASSCELLRNVVDDVLDFSKVESGNLQVNLQPVDLKHVLKNVVDTCSAHAKKSQNVSIRILYDESLGRIPTTFETDSRLLLQILFNLIGNAIKFSKYGGVIDVQLSIRNIDFVDQQEGAQQTRQQQPHVTNRDLHTSGTNQFGNKRLCISVKDYGRGIEKGQMDRIFSPFHQCDNNTPTSSSSSAVESTEYVELFDSAKHDNALIKSHKERGTGLGLTIAHSIVTALGGSIKVESEYGSWSEFIVSFPYCNHDEHGGGGDPKPVLRTISLPTTTNSLVGVGESTVELPTFEFDRSYRQNSQDSLPQTTDNPARKGLLHPGVVDSRSGISRKHLKVLIAEDNLVNQKVLQRTLQKLGLCHIDIVNNGAEAVDITLKNHYDVIFMDIQMPIMDGFEATRRIVRRRQHRDNLKNTLILSNGLLTSKSMDDVPSALIDDDSTSTSERRHSYTPKILEQQQQQKKKRQQQSKIVFLSAHTSDSFKEKTLEVGGDDYISKPFNIKQIQRIFDNM